MPARTKSKTVLKKEQELVLFFQIQERKLNAAVDKMSRKAIRQDGATPAMLKNYREQVREILAEMQTKSADLGQALVRSAYGEGVEIADAALKANGISVIANPGMIHVQTAKVMAEAITNRFGDVTGAIGRRVDDIFRTVQLEMASASAMGYEGVKEAARNIRDELLDRGIGFFKDSAGKLWNLETRRNGRHHSDDRGQKPRHLERVRGARRGSCHRLDPSYELPEVRALAGGRPVPLRKYPGISDDP